jgi:hypothetical protein
MESFEEFKTINTKQKAKIKRGKYSVMEEEDNNNDELEIEYLKQLI